MWTHRFYSFAKARKLSMVHPPVIRGGALLSNWRMKGEHYDGDEGKDAELLTADTDELRGFPDQLEMLGKPPNEMSWLLRCAGTHT